MKRESIFCKEAIPYFIVSLLLVALTAWLFPLLLPAPIGLLLFFAWFFRNPVRPFQSNDLNYYSPADGQVMAIQTVDDELVGPRSKKVTIFLSPFNVHVNRTPRKGEIVQKLYKEGKFLPAYKPHAADENERCTLAIRCSDQSYYKVIQITGILARRIVNDGEIGRLLSQGQRFGMIKFGSCTEIILPEKVELQVQVGQQLRGMSTLLACLPQKRGNS